MQVNAKVGRNKARSGEGQVFTKAGRFKAEMRVVAKAGSYKGRPKQSQVGTNGRSLQRPVGTKAGRHTVYALWRYSHFKMRFKRSMDA